MKKISVLFLAFFCNFIYAQQTNIKNTINTFFEGLHKRDTIKMKSVCVKSFQLQTIEENGIVSNLIQMPIKKFFQNLATMPTVIAFEERFSDYKIEVDGTMAHVWMPYEFYFNEKFSHKGVNSMTLFKDEGTWKIVHIIDTRRK
jgi:hypothetical protein